MSIQGLEPYIIVLCLVVIVSLGIAYRKLKRGYKSINNRVDTYLRARFQQLRREYVTLVPPDEQLTSEPIQHLLEKFKDDKRPVEWQDLYEIELAFLKAQSFDVLRARAWKYRSDYQDIVGERVYTRYQANGDEKLKKANAAETEEEKKQAKIIILADLELVLSELYRLYNLQIARECVRDVLLRIVSFSTAFVLIVLFFNVGNSYYHWEGHQAGVPYILLVAVSGAMGGFISMQMRLQDTTLDDRPMSNLLGLVYGKASIYLAPINGFLFAILLYLILAGGLVTGKVFPTINSPKETQGVPVIINTFLLKSGPTSGEGFAGMLVWAFVAGFAERLVPDTLGRLIAKTKDVNDKAKNSAST